MNYIIVCINNLFCLWSKCADKPKCNFMPEEDLKNTIYITYGETAGDVDNEIKVAKKNGSNVSWDPVKGNRAGIKGGKISRAELLKQYKFNKKNWYKTLFRSPVVAAVIKVCNEN